MLLTLKKCTSHKWNFFSHLLIIQPKIVHDGDSEFLFNFHDECSCNSNQTNCLKWLHDSGSSMKIKNKNKGTQRIVVQMFAQIKYFFDMMCLSQ